MEIEGDYGKVKWRLKGILEK